MSPRFCLFVAVVTMLLLSGWISITYAQVIFNNPATPADWREQLCIAQSMPGRRDSYDAVEQTVPPQNPLNSLHLGHDYIIGGIEADVIQGGLGNGCYMGFEDTDRITLVSQNTDTKYVIDDDENRDVITCIGKPLRLIIDISEALRRVTPDVRGCPNYITVQ